MPSRIHDCKAPAFLCSARQAMGAVIGGLVAPPPGEYEIIGTQNV